MDIVIVNWNSGAYLKKCLDSLSAPEVSKVIVVDNNSSDDSFDCVAAHDNIKLIKSSSNLGFAKACNIGASHGISDYILFLNPDAAVFPGTIKNLLFNIGNLQCSRVGIFGVQLIDEFGVVARSCSRFPSSIGFLSHAIGLDRLYPNLGNTMTEWKHDKTQQVDQVIGAFFVVRRELFEILGGFDDRFFVYFEEVDFSYRARQIGWSSVYLSDVQAFHAGGGTTNQIKARRLFYSLRSRLLYVDKHFSGVEVALAFLVTFFLEPISRLAQAAIRFSWHGIMETGQGYIMLWRWLLRWIVENKKAM